MKHYIAIQDLCPSGFDGTQQRADLRRRCVVPLLRNQISEGFTWVVTSGIGMEGLHLEGIDHLTLGVPPPPTFDRITYMVQQIVSEVASGFPKGEKVITTRLNNDDLLMPHHIEAAQAPFRQEDGPRVVDVPGFRVDARFGKVYQDTHYAEHDTHYAEHGVPSPFISLVEQKVGRRCRVRTAYYDQHSVMHRHFEVMYLERPAWIHLIHGSNKTMARPEADLAARGCLLPVGSEEFLGGVVEGQLPAVSGESRRTE